MLQGIVITVRYAGPTSTRGGRWIVRADHPIGGLVVNYDHRTNPGIDNAKRAADALVTRWNLESMTHIYAPEARVIVAGGHTVDGYAFVVGCRIDIETEDWCEDCNDTRPCLSAAHPA